MRLLMPLLLLAVAPMTSVAADADAREAFAVQMIECSHRHQIFALGPGTASAVAKAKKESKKYVTAAVKVTSAQFVEQRTPELRPAAEAFVVAEFNASKSVDEIKQRWAAMLASCDAALAAAPN